MVGWIKNVAVKFGLIVFRLFPRERGRSKLYRRLFLADLYRKDILQYRLVISRDLGVKIGDNCRLYSMNFFSEPYLIEIGDHVLVSGNVIFITHDFGVFLFKDEEPNIFGNYGKIKIGNNCFIGMNTIILPNVQIGDNCLICAGSVVMESFPSDSIIMGNPARVVFKTSMYKKMKLNDPGTVRNSEYPYPFERLISNELKREILLEHLSNIPIREPKQNS